MKKQLLFDFEKDLDKEAKRLADLFLEIYEKREVINMSFEDAVNKYIKECYSYYHVDIEFRILKYIPSNLTYDFSNKYILITKEESIINHLVKYSNFCITKSKDKNPKISAKIFAQKLIDMYKADKINNLGLPEILHSNMSELYVSHHDSVDAMTVILYLQDAIEKLGYRIINISPLKIERIK